MPRLNADEGVGVAKGVAAAILSTEFTGKRAGDSGIIAIGTLGIFDHLRGHDLGQYAARAFDRGFADDLGDLICFGALSGHAGLKLLQLGLERVKLVDGRGMKLLTLGKPLLE